MTSNDRLLRRTSRIVKVIPPPPRELTLDGQRLSWVEPQATNYVSHYLIRVGTDASDPRHKVPVGQTSITMAFGDAGFWLSSWNDAMESESQKVYLDARVEEATSADDVRRYGAIGDGRDDSQAIIDCLTENGSACLPPGYTFSSNPVNAASVPSIRIYGGGTWKLIDGATGPSLLTITTVPDVEIDGIVFDGNQANNPTMTAAHILATSDCASIRINNTKFINTRQGPFTSLSPAVSSQIRLQNVTVKASGYEGIKLDVGTTGRVIASGLDISSVTSAYAFHIVGGTKHMVVGARVFGNFGGVAMWTTGTGTLVGCTITGNSSAALSFLNGTFRHVGCILAGNGSVYASSLVAYSVLSEGVSDMLPDLLLKSADPFFEQRLVDGTLVGELRGGSIMARGGAASLAIKRANDSKVLTANDASGFQVWNATGTATVLNVGATSIVAGANVGINGVGNNAPLVVKNTGAAEVLRIYDSGLNEMASAKIIGDCYIASITGPSYPLKMNVDEKVVAAQVNLAADVTGILPSANLNHAHGVTVTPVLTTFVLNYKDHSGTNQTVTVVTNVSNAVVCGGPVDL